MNSHNPTAILIMKLQFTNKGLLLLQQKLYQQCDEILKTQAELIKYDINAWMSNTFILSKAQLDFFESIDPQLKLTLSLDISFTIENRLPIRLNSHPSVKHQQMLHDLTKTQPIANYQNGVLLLNIKVNHKIMQVKKSSIV